MPRRILLLITDLEIGGTPTVVRELAIRLNDPPNVVVEVACLKGWGPVANQLKAAGIEVTAFGARRAWQLFRAARQLRQLVRSHSADTVFSFLVHANAVAAIAARRLTEVRFLQSIQTVQRTPHWHWWVQGWAQRHAKTIVGPSSAVADVAMNRCGVQRDRVVVIPNAVDPGEFPRVETFASERVRVGYLGRLDPVKGIAGFFICVGRSAKKDARIEGHIFGDGPDRAYVERRVIEMRPTARFVYHGLVKTPQEALRQMDVLFLPSTVEGFGLVLIEAMASGVPVIAIGKGGTLDVVDDKVNGLLLDFDIQTLDEDLWLALRTLIDQPQTRAALITGGLRTVSERFSWDAVLPQYKKLLLLDGSNQS